MTFLNTSCALDPASARDALDSLDARVRTALILIESDGYSKTSIQRLAASVNLSTTRLTHLFKENVGMSPRGYDTRFRLSKAEKLLRTTYLRIKEIEVKCGFKDSSRFARQFKKAFGLTPKEYRAHALAGQPAGSPSRVAPYPDTHVSESGIGLAKSAHK